MAIKSVESMYVESSANLEKEVQVYFLNIKWMKSPVIVAMYIPNCSDISMENGGFLLYRGDNSIVMCLIWINSGGQNRAKSDLVKFHQSASFFKWLFLWKI